MYRRSKNRLPLSLLQISGSLPAHSRDLLTETWVGLPLVVSRPIQVSFLPELTASRGKLLSQAVCGTPVQAATFIRERRMVLEQGLLVQSPALCFFFVHEIFHFAWTRLGNERRREYGRLLMEELRTKARGELGESAGLKKAEVLLQPTPLSQPKLWRDYVCESFCDSAACLLCNGPVHDGFKLSKRRIAIRSQWFQGEELGARRWLV